MNDDAVLEGEELGLAVADEDVEEDSVWEADGVDDADAVALELAVAVVEAEEELEAELDADDEGVRVTVEVDDAELRTTRACW
jgi:hypothetical protein